MDIKIDSVPDQNILTSLREDRVRQAAVLMVQYYGTTIFGVCEALANQAGDAEELTHQAFRQAFTRLNAFREQSSPRTWLVDIARQTCSAGDGAEAFLSTGELIEIVERQQPGALVQRMPESLKRRLAVLAASL